MGQTGSAGDWTWRNFQSEVIEQVIEGGGKALIALPLEWRPVVGWEGLYEVSNDGQVRSVDRTLVARDGKTYHYKGKVLKQVQNAAAGGHMHVYLTRNSKKTTAKVHQLVLEAFIGPRPKGKITRHVDGDPTNNRLTNLVWGTHAENTADTLRHGTHKQATATRCKQGHEFTDDNTYWYTRPGTGRKRRVCRACAIERTQRRRKEVKDASRGVEVA